MEEEIKNRKLPLKADIHLCIGGTPGPTVECDVASLLALYGQLLQA